eukprot:gb/GECH01006336.1/.p1 GENE.gb/GECH01006336.1/~~gb/GECH01006336.1/.p1  ORF type:complete len:313 (+),score=84.32 gb/GECH01006336.1/:1-939(+)
MNFISDKSEDESYLILENQTLSQETLGCILSFLSPRSLTQAMLVCKEWYMLCHLCSALQKTIEKGKLENEYQISTKLLQLKRKQVEQGYLGSGKTKLWVSLYSASTGITFAPLSLILALLAPSATVPARILIAAAGPFFAPIVTSNQISAGRHPFWASLLGVQMGVVAVGGSVAAVTVFTGGVVVPFAASLLFTPIAGAAAFGVVDVLGGGILRYLRRWVRHTLETESRRCEQEAEPYSPFSEDGVSDGSWEAIDLEEVQRELGEVPADLSDPCDERICAAPDLRFFKDRCGHVVAMFCDEELEDDHGYVVI